MPADGGELAPHVDAVSARRQRPHRTSFGIRNPVRGESGIRVHGGDGVALLPANRSEVTSNVTVLPLAASASTQLSLSGFHGVITPVATFAAAMRLRVCPPMAVQKTAKYRQCQPHFEREPGGGRERFLRTGCSPRRALRAGGTRHAAP